MRDRRRWRAIVAGRKLLLKIEVQSLKRDRESRERERERVKERLSTLHEILSKMLVFKSCLSI